MRIGSELSPEGSEINKILSLLLWVNSQSNKWRDKLEFTAEDIMRVIYFMFQKLMTVANLIWNRSKILIDYLVNKFLLTETGIGLSRESNQFGLGLAEFEVRHSGRDDLDTDEKLSPKFKRYLQSQKDVRGKKI